MSSKFVIRASRHTCFSHRIIVTRNPACPSTFFFFFVYNRPWCVARRGARIPLLCKARVIKCDFALLSSLLVWLLSFFFFSFFLLFSFERVSESVKRMLSISDFFGGFLLWRFSSMIHFSFFYIRSLYITREKVCKWLGQQWEFASVTKL